jgi:hypothetical protein
MNLGSNFEDIGFFLRLGLLRLNMDPISLMYSFTTSSVFFFLALLLFYLEELSLGVAKFFIYLSLSR